MSEEKTGRGFEDYEAPTTAQAEAADPNLSAWVAANAGSGKTKVLIDRVARLLLGGAEPASILCVTYTKAAANEMLGRLFKRLGSWAVLPEEEIKEHIRFYAGMPLISGEGLPIGTLCGSGHRTARSDGPATYHAAGAGHATDASDRIAAGLAPGGGSARRDRPPRQEFAANRGVSGADVQVAGRQCSGHRSAVGSRAAH